MTKKHILEKSESKGTNRTRIQTYIDPVLKENSEEVLSSMGLTINSAIQIFLNRVVATESLPLNLELTKSEKDKYNLLREIRSLPTDKIETKDELQKWLKEDSEDYE